MPSILSGNSQVVSADYMLHWCQGGSERRKVTAMTYDKALDIIIPAYNFFVSTTFTADDIEEMLINMLVRKGANKSSAKVWVKKFLDD